MRADEMGRECRDCGVRSGNAVTNPDFDMIACDDDEVVARARHGSMGLTWD